MVAVFATISAQHSLAQDSTQSALLTTYYGIKDALVSSNAAGASAKAAEFIHAASIADEHTLPAENRIILIKEAVQISKSTDLKQQRELFAGFSADMVTLAKAVKLSGNPVYQQFCPMKKASWLSSSQVVKNPYFGSAMLTCGKVTETF